MMDSNTYSIDKDETVRITRIYNDGKAMYIYTIWHWVPPRTSRSFWLKREIAHYGWWDWSSRTTAESDVNSWIKHYGMEKVTLKDKAGTNETRSD